MAATTTPSMSSLVSLLKKRYPEFDFQTGERFAWNPIDSIVLFETAGSPARLLHELGHAILGHQSYQRDVELVKMESEAWQKATELAPTYAVELKPDDIAEHMDSYRDWLHARSTCPTCGANGLQVDNSHYRCIECQTTWRVNEARTCGLKRYTETKNTP